MTEAAHVPSSAPDPSVGAGGIDALLDELSDPSSPRAAGAACAIAAAMAAALVVRATSAADADGPRSPGAAAQAARLRVRLTALGEQNAAAYAAARALLEDAGTAGDTDERLGAALARAAEVPVQVAEAAADVALLARTSADRGAADRRVDAVAAARLAAGAAEGAERLVLVNLAVRPGDGLARRARAAAAAARSAAVEVAGL